MSHAAIAAVLARHDLSAGERLVAWSLASFANTPGLLEHVMKQAGGDDFVWLPMRAQQRTNLNRMGDGRRLLDLPVLIRVAGRGERERDPCDWQPGERSCGAMRPHDGAVPDLWMSLSRHELWSRCERTVAGRGRAAIIPIG